VRATTTTVLYLIFALTSALHVSSAFGSSSHKCKEPACDIDAIGYRKLFNGLSVGNWYSTEKEKEIAGKYATAIEQKVDIVKDAAISAYIDQVAQRIVQNSDADMPITVRLIRRNDAGAFTLWGGHLYLTTGLLLKLQSEGELASVVARGIAHTAMHSVAQLQTRATLMQVASIPVINLDGLPHAPSGNDLSVPTLGLMKFQRDFELQADYFGIQYVYKSGYDTNCFLSAVQSLWERDPSTTLSKAFSPFPPLPERLNMLRQEIDDILPGRAEAAVSSSEFDEFLAHLRQIAAPASPPDREAQPRLIRHDPASNE
jgi:predicted Zn-dependent protease